MQKLPGDVGDKRTSNSISELTIERLSDCLRGGPLLPRESEGA
jgi:hypothetical protein